MTKIIEIKNCADCPYINSKILKSMISGVIVYCSISENVLGDNYLHTIPSWCPLPDKEPDVKA